MAAAKCSGARCAYRCHSVPGAELAVHASVCANRLSMLKDTGRTPKNLAHDRMVVVISECPSSSATVLMGTPAGTVVPSRSWERCSFGRSKSACKFDVPSTDRRLGLPAAFRHETSFLRRNVKG